MAVVVATAHGIEHQVEQQAAVMKVGESGDPAKPVGIIGDAAGVWGKELRYPVGALLHAPEHDLKRTVLIRLVVSAEPSLDRALGVEALEPRQGTERQP